MTRSVRSTIATLFVGGGIQRGLALVAAFFVMRELGPAPLGELGAALQVGAILALVADSGIRSVAAREAAAAPENAAAWLRGAVHARLVAATALYAPYAALILLTGLGDAGLLLVTGLLAFLIAFDLKDLSEALGITRREVALESTAALVNVIGTLAALALGHGEVFVLAVVAVAARGVYALGAAWTVLRLPARGERVPVRRLLFSTSGLSVAQAANRLVLASDVILLRLLASPLQTGLYVAAQRVASAAEFPMALLGRALQPHLHHAARRGNAAATLARTLRASAYLVLPIAAGGVVVATPLLQWIRDDYGPASTALVFLLANASIVGIGSRFGNTLFAQGRTRAYVMPLVLGLALNVLLTVLLIPPFGAAGSAGATVIAACVTIGASYFLLRKALTVPLIAPLWLPALVAAATAAAAWLAPFEDVLARVACGGVVTILLLWALEFRRGWSALGTGLHGASGLPDGADERAEEHDA